MLELTINGNEFLDESTGEFVVTDSRKVKLEHSLLSISKWESKWHKPFLSTTEKTAEEMVSYIECMSITPIDKDTLNRFTLDNIKAINEYMNDSMTATTIKNRRKKSRSREILTSEVIYYYMIVNDIPIECEKWHLNRLLTLIEVCGVKNVAGEKMSKKEQMEEQRALNAARRAKTGSSG